MTYTCKAFLNWRMVGRPSRKKSFPFRDGFQAKKNRHRQFFAHTVFKFIFHNFDFLHCLRSITSKDHPILLNCTHIFSSWLVEGFSTHFGFLWFALSWFLETYSTCLVHILQREEQRMHLCACEYARKAIDDVISQNNDRIGHHLLALISDWRK